MKQNMKSTSELTELNGWHGYCECYSALAGWKGLSTAILAPHIHQEPGIRFLNRIGVIQ